MTVVTVVTMIFLFVLIALVIVALPLVLALVISQGNKTMATLQDLLTAVAATDTKLNDLQTSVDNISAAPDLQPAVDAITAIDAKVDAIKASADSKPH